MGKSGCRINGENRQLTPNEVFFAIGDDVLKRLAKTRESAREKRMKENRATGCGVCVEGASSGALLLQRPRSRML